MLLQQLNTDLKAAMRSKNILARDTIRMVLADIQSTAKEKKRELSEVELIQVLARQKKTREQSIIAFQSGGRPDLADKERQEINIIDSYLPTQLSTEEVQEIVQLAIKELNALKSDMGKVMSAVMPKVQGRFPGKEVSAIVKLYLEEK